MPNKQKHRGKHPNDIKNFNIKWHNKLNAAVKDLSYLLTRSYSDKSALKVVGDRYRLNERQRKAVLRMSVPDGSIFIRSQKEIPASQIQGKAIAIDGYNLLITLECALSGGYLFLGMDNCLRDIASIHSTYKKVEETIPALTLIGDVLKKLEPASIHWYLDSPISNSGKLKTLMLELSEKNQYNWEVSVVFNPDKELIELKNEYILSTCDGWILDESEHWCNILSYIVKNHVMDAEIINLKL